MLINALVLLRFLISKKTEDENIFKHISIYLLFINFIIISYNYTNR